jgi:uncharacterized membrane protein (UPF0127 family)
MARWVEVRNRTQDRHVLTARWCSSFLCRLRGLTFRRSMPAGEGLLLVEAQPGRAQTAIHMWMVFMPLGVIWLDEAFHVVDTRLARPWRIYVPSSSAKYVLEGEPAVLECVARGDVLETVDARLG